MIATAEQRELVGPYRLLKAIGAGGSARIDLARIDRAYNFQRHVVVKRPLEHLRDDTRAAASLQREARIGGLLRHPNLIAVLDAGNHDGYDYLVLEYVHGASLRALMQVEAPGRVRALPIGVALALISDVARGLHHAHELVDEHGAPLGLVHRDVSPGNILVGFDGSVKLADFGIAKETRVATLSGSMHGTVTYMAPEQCRGHAFDRRADVFSLGVILYELCTGTRLFWADNDVASLHRVLSGNVPRPRKVNPQIPAALEDAILTAVAHDPDRRFTTTRALAGAVEHIAGELGVVLGARWIARWVEDALGPRDVPWIGSATVPDAPPSEGSLVELIAAAPDAADDHVSVDFGPSDPAASEETAPDKAAPARRARRRRRSAVIATALLGTLAVGAATIVVFVDDPLAVVRTSAPPPAPEQPAAEPAAPAQQQEIEMAADPEPEPQKPVKGSSKRVIRVKPKPAKRDPEPAAVVAQPAAPATTGSGAPPKTTGSKTKPQWDPTLLLPSDSGSGTRKR